MKPETHKKIKNFAKERKISVSKFIREAAEKRISKEYPKSKKNPGVLFRDAARYDAMPGGPPDLGSNDDYLYKLP